jgi:menaquinone-dependent protoporphyrinogen oxidase
MKLLLLYATTQGQTRKIMRHIADRLVAQGHAVELLPADQAADQTGALDLSRFDAAILAGSIHAGRYQTELLQAAHAMSPTLNRLPGLFLSVSLTAAGNDADERAELDRLAQGFLTDTGWMAPTVLQVAGALKFSDYSFFVYWAMRWIARSRGIDASPGADLEFTDWPALDAAVDGFLARASG